VARVVGVVELAVHHPQAVGGGGCLEQLVVARLAAVEQPRDEAAEGVAALPGRRLETVGDELEVLGAAGLEREVVLLMVVVRDTAIDEEDLGAVRKIIGPGMRRVEGTVLVIKACL